MVFSRFLLSALTPWMLFSSIITVTNPGDSGTDTLREAIVTTAINDDTIVFTVNPNLTAVISKSGLLDLTINGNNPYTIINQSSSTANVRHFSLSACEFTFNNMSFEAPAASNAGGLDIANGSSMTFNESKLGNLKILDVGPSTGGAINASNSSVELTNTLVDSCSVIGDLGASGGGIYLGSGSMATISSNSIIQFCTVQSAKEPAMGGGIALDASSATLSDSMIKSCKVDNASVSAFGGGMFLQNGSSANLTNTTIQLCSAESTIGASGTPTSFGGGVALNASSITLTGSLMDNCVARNDTIAARGGGFALQNASTATLTSTTVQDCQADAYVDGADPLAYGGGFYLEAGSTANLSGSTIRSCSATSESRNAFGGGMCLITSQTTLVDSSIENCQAAHAYDVQDATGGGIYANDGSTVTLTNSSISGCLASFAPPAPAASSKAASNNSVMVGVSYGLGGGAALFTSPLTMTGGVITSCTASSTSTTNIFAEASGGGVYSYNTTITLNDVTISDCQAKSTSVSSSVTALGGGVCLRQSQGNLTNASFMNNQVSATTGAGAISALGGAIYLDASSILNINGSAHFSGNNASFGKDIFVVDGGTINFNLTQNVEIPNPIEGDISVNLAESASRCTNSVAALPPFTVNNAPGVTLTLNGDNTYSSPTTITSGELCVNGSVTSDITVENGAIFSGNCTIKAGNDGPGDLTNHGTVSPGKNGVGTMMIEGAYTQSSTGNFLVDITPTGERDQIFLSPDGANIAGDLTVVLGDGSYIKGTTYEIITGTVTGSFNEPINKVGAQADNVIISVHPGSIILMIDNTLLFAGQTVNPGNPQTVVDAFDDENLDPNSPMAQLFEAMGQLSNADLNATLNHMTPAPFGVYEWINLTNNSLAARIIAKHVNDLPCSKRNCCQKRNQLNGWINGFGNFMNEEQYRCLRGFESNTGGVLAGIDHCSPKFIFGAAVGYIHTHMLWDDFGGKGNINSYLGALYGSYLANYGVIDASVMGGWNHYNTSRRLLVSMVDLQAQSNPDAGFFTAHLGGRLHGKMGKIDIEPLGVVDYHYLYMARFKESDGGAGMALDVRNRVSNMMQTTLGCLFKTVVKTKNTCFEPFAALSWVRKIPLNVGRYYANFIGQDEKFRAFSFAGYKDFISPEVGVKATSTTGVSFSAGYRGELNNQAKIHQLDARMEVVF